MNDKPAVDLDRLDMAIRRLEPPILSLAYLSRMDWENDAILSNVVESLANELRHQYSILYRPEPMKTDGSYQRVDIVVRDRSNLVVRSRRGYYSPTL